MIFSSRLRNLLFGKPCLSNTGPGFRRRLKGLNGRRERKDSGTGNFGGTSSNGRRLFGSISRSGNRIEDLFFIELAAIPRQIEY